MHNYVYISASNKYFNVPLQHAPIVLNKIPSSKFMPSYLIWLQQRKTLNDLNAILNMYSKSKHNNSLGVKGYFEALSTLPKKNISVQSAWTRLQSERLLGLNHQVYPGQIYILVIVLRFLSI